MITGFHTIIYSTNAEADRIFFRDVLNFPYVDVGDGWLIFKMPPGEAAFHPSENNGKHEFHLMCDDIEQFVSSMNALDVPCTDVEQQPWGRLVDITLPGGSQLGVYQALHARPESV